MDPKKSLILETIGNRVDGPKDYYIGRGKLWVKNYKLDMGKKKIPEVVG